MTKKEFDKVNELILKLKKIENDKRYFGLTNLDEKVQFPFSFSFKKKRGKIYCTVRPFWTINAQPIAVDEEFVKYCKKYFVEKANKLKEEIDSYFDEKTSPEIEKKDKGDESEQVVQLLLDMLKNKKQQEEMIEENVTNSEEILEVSDL
jgi:hypothetical protein